MLGVFIVGSVVGAVIAFRGWPALGRTLLAYGLAARIPVAIVMLLAILGDWGTHYDVPPPGFPAMDPIPKWLLIGLLPQMTIWIWYTIVVGALFGGIFVALTRRARRPGIATGLGALLLLSAAAYADVKQPNCFKERVLAEQVKSLSLSNNLLDQSRKSSQVGASRARVAPALHGLR